MHGGNDVWLQIVEVHTKLCSPSSGNVLPSRTDSFHAACTVSCVDTVTMCLWLSVHLLFEIYFGLSVRICCWRINAVVILSLIFGADLTMAQMVHVCVCFRPICCKLLPWFGELKFLIPDVGALTFWRNHENKNEDIEREFANYIDYLDLVVFYYIEIW